jgi:DNA-binding IclR family transcriptional regulator
MQAEGRHSTRALDRVTAILEAVAVAREASSVTDVSTRVGLSLPTVSRLMRDLSAAGLLERAHGNGGYTLGPRLLAIAGAASRQSTLTELALPVLEGLRDASGETASLHIPVGVQRVCIAEIQSRHEVRRVVSVGLSLPLETGATGLALLAHLDPADQERYLADVPAASRPELEERLKEAAAVGFAQATDAWVKGVAGVAAPVMGPRGAVACISVSGPNFRWTDAAMSAFAPTLLAATRRVARELSGVPVESPAAAVPPR